MSSALNIRNSSSLEICLVADYNNSLIYIYPGEVDRFNANREKYGGNMEGNVEIWETWRKYGRNIGEMWKYEGIWKYERNIGAILVDNMNTK